MSRLIPGLSLPDPAPPSEPVPAAAVILHRAGARGREVLWVRRGAVRFAGGFIAFPGGRLDEDDGRAPVPGRSGEAAAFTACAVRELFEETGVLLARGPPLPRAARDEGRRALLSGTLDLAGFLARHGLSLDGDALAPAGRWVTPPWSQLRYDARLFLAELPAGEAVEVWPGELDEGEWVVAAEAVARWERGEVLLHPPNLWGLACLAGADPADPGRALERLNRPPFTERFVSRRVEFQRGLFLVPLRTPTLPPATHTNAWLVALDGGGLAVVDPGAAEPAELALLERVLEDLAPEAGPLREVWLTHAHPDHVGGVGPLLARHPGTVLRGHPVTLSGEWVRGAGASAGAVAAAPLADGALLDGRWRAVFTPGHHPGHLAFLDERTGALLAGDMVSTLSTIVIDPPEGDMAAYRASLARLAALGPRTLFPAHGMPVQGAVARLEASLAHRRQREAKVLAALPGTLSEVTARAYDDTPPEVHPVAARSCLASLLELTRAGTVTCRGERWSRG